MSKSDAIERAKQLLAEVGIDPARFNTYPHTFSGGMRQEWWLHLLCSRTFTIIADEPTTALDVSVQAQILRLLKTLCSQRGTAIILITHDMGVIAQTADRVAVLYAGRLAEVGRTYKILHAPKHPYTKGLVAATPKIDASSVAQKLYQIPGSIPSLDQIPTGCAFHPRCAQAVAKCQQARPPLLSGGGMLAP